ncbi:MAG: histidinol dehydrogenase [Bacteroidetes bacterium]|nr:histidinol dehydrogenase [Bacteroidota bacterium]
MKIYKHPERTLWHTLCQRPQWQTEILQNRVQDILSQVKSVGDKAILELTHQFDRVNLKSITVSPEEISASANQIPDALKEAIQLAAQNIHRFHAIQKKETEKIETTPGVICWRKAVPIERIGIYIPGGSAPLFSTVLMLGIPAKLAGCKEVVLCSPPNQHGKIHPAILFAARSVGINTIFKAGGAQAIAAMAYGTESIPFVYKIFGPGNQFVTKAKQLVSLEGTAIDMPAGPSEVLVLADENADASFVAADLLSQAEHGPDSQVVLVTYTHAQVLAVLNEIEKQKVKMPRKEIAEEALKNSRAIILNQSEAIEFINEYAPEHLIINTTDCELVADLVVNAGSVFLGAHSPESVGDYASGTNHTLPTNGYAKSGGGISLDSFMKYITFQQLTPQGLQTLEPTVTAMAEAEQLPGHAEAVKIRLQAYQKIKTTNCD